MATLDPAVEARHDEEADGWIQGNRMTDGAAPPVPDFATHYHRAGRAPFLNLSDLDPGELELALADLERQRSQDGLRRVFGRRYMELRRLTERRLYDLFVEAGGRPERESPHYFCLGSCQWFLELAPDMREVVVPLADLPEAVTSFTYPDSFTAMGCGPSFGLPAFPRPYHGRVYLLPDLPEIVNEYGFPAGDPDEDYRGYAERPFEKYIEIQLWSDEPVRAFWDTTAS